jgi:EmrB/QacA subfamily drug resistance transporter
LDRIIPDASRSKNLSILPFVVAAAFFMEYLDTTVIATALPQMAKTFRVGPNEVSLGMTAYMLSLAVFIPVSGWVADRFGSRTVFAAALITFTCASVLCGSANGLTWFTLTRVLQGIGGAMMVPVGRAIVVRNTPTAGLMRAISTITWPAIVAPVIGPTLGGFITTYASWRWVFFLNVPFGVATLIAALKLVPNQKEKAKRRLDMPGFFLSGTALICILYGTELASHENSSLITACGLIGAGILVGAVAVWRLRTTPSPLLDLSTLKIQTYSVTVLWGSASRTGIEAVPYLMPLLLQIGFGFSAFHSGLMLLASACGNLGMKVFTTPILRRFGFRPVAILNIMIAAAFVAACGWLEASTPLLIMLAVLLCYGLARSLQFTLLATLAYADVGDRQRSSASTLWSVAQQMTIGMGIALGALCLRLSSYVGAPDSGNGGVGCGPAGCDHVHLSLTNFRWAFSVAAAVALVSVIGYVKLPRSAGDAVRG